MNKIIYFFKYKIYNKCLFEILGTILLVILAIISTGFTFAHIILICIIVICIKRINEAIKNDIKYKMEQLEHINQNLDT